MDTLITLASTIATTAHHGTTRADGDPYITHPATVAHYATTTLGADGLTIAACWLHDTVEDTSLTLEHLGVLGIPHPVLAAVDALTIRPGERYLEAVARANADPIARVVKLCDNWHNSTTLDIFTSADRERRGRKYHQARSILTAA